MSLSNPPPLQVIQKPNVAIILNTNARSVTADMIPLAESVLGEDAVYCTTTAEQAQQAALSLIKQNVSLVVAVGGDGTLSSMINYLTQSIIQHQKHNSTFTVDEAVAKLPTMAFIPMGTGNGVGSVVACQAPIDIVKPSLFTRIFRRKALKHEKFVQVLKLLPMVGNDLAYGTTNINDMVDLVELPMLEVTTPRSEQDQGDLCFFAGVGFDSLLLQDFKDVKAWSVRRGILRETLGSVTGYVVALVSKTLPKCIQRNAHQIQVEITSTDPHAVWIDHRRGDVVRKLTSTTQGDAPPTAPTLVYKGTAGIVAAGTSPYYGGGLRLFPFARMTLDKMHLRVGRIHPLRGFLQIPRIFRGSYRDTRPGSFGCLDFLASDFTVSVRPTTTDGTIAAEDTTTTTPKKNGYPLQHSGEAIGSYEQFRLRVVPAPVKFITFFKKRIVDDTLPSL